MAVLVFVWGAFAFVSKVAGRRPWHLLPCIAMLAYGWVFHMGFFNFYLSLGLCFWALALAWEPAAAAGGGRAAIWPWRIWRTALPVVWSVCLLVYLWLARRCHPRRRALLDAGGAGVDGARPHASPPHLRALVAAADRQHHRRGPGLGLRRQVLLGAGGPAVPLGLLFLELIHAWGARAVLSSMPFRSAS